MQSKTTTTQAGPRGYHDGTLMPFGAHKGAKLGDVPARYLLWLSDEIRKEGVPLDAARRLLLAYVSENRKALELEVAEQSPDRRDSDDD